MNSIDVTHREGSNSEAGTAGVTKTKAKLDPIALVVEPYPRHCLRELPCRIGTGVRNRKFYAPMDTGRLVTVLG